MTDETVSVEFLRRQLAAANAMKNSTTGGSGIPPHGSMNDERVGRLEGIVDGLKHTQTQLLVAIGVVAAFVVGFGIYTLQRVDQVGNRIDAVNDKVVELPGKIGGELRDITKTLADAITAARQPVPKR